MLNSFNAFATTPKKNGIPSRKNIKTIRLYVLLQKVLESPEKMDEYLEKRFTHPKDQWKKEAFELFLSGMKPFYIEKRFRVSSGSVNQILRDIYDNVSSLYSHE